MENWKSLVHWEVSTHPSYSLNPVPSDYHPFRSLRNCLNGVEFHRQKRPAKLTCRSFSPRNHTKVLQRRDYGFTWKMTKSSNKTAHIWFNKLRVKCEKDLLRFCTKIWNCFLLGEQQTDTRNYPRQFTGKSGNETSTKQKQNQTWYTNHGRKIASYYPQSLNPSFSTPITVTENPTQSNRRSPILCPGQNLLSSACSVLLGFKKHVATQDRAIPHSLAAIETFQSLAGRCLEFQQRSKQLSKTRNLEPAEEMQLSLFPGMGSFGLWLLEFRPSTNYY